VPENLKYNNFVIFVIIGRKVLNLLSASVAKNQHYHPCKKNCTLDKKMIPPFKVDRTSSISVQSLEEIELRAPAVGAKIGVFLYVTLGLPARGGHSSDKYCVTVYGSILMRFQHFFRMDCSVRCTT